MGEVKRYWARDLDSEWQTLSVTAADYARLERKHAAAQAELTRLRAVEAEVIGLRRVKSFATALLAAIHYDEDDASEEYKALAEACGRKG